MNIFDTVYKAIFTHMSGFEFLACLAESFITMEFCDRFLGFKKPNIMWLKSLMFFATLAFHSVFFTVMSEYKYISIFLLLVIIFSYSVSMGTVDLKYGHNTSSSQYSA